MPILEQRGSPQPLRFPMRQILYYDEKMGQSPHPISSTKLQVFHATKVRLKNIFFNDYVAKPSLSH